MRENEKDAPRCGGCRYFIQHYRKDADGTYAPVNCGHCVRSRARQRKNAGKACADYAPSGEFEMEGKRGRQVSSNIEEELLLRLRDIAARGIPPAFSIELFDSIVLCCFGLKYNPQRFYKNQPM